MAKRRLNKRQQWRIEKIQKERTVRAARKEKAVEEQAAAGELGPEQNGLVIAHYGQQLDIEALEGPGRGEEDGLEHVEEHRRYIFMKFET